MPPLHMQQFFEWELEALKSLAEDTTPQKKKTKWTTTATQNMDYIIAAMGAWEEKTIVCTNWTQYHRNPDQKDDPDSLWTQLAAKVQPMVQAMYEYSNYTGTLVLWRTAGYWTDNTPYKDTQFAYIFNQLVMDEIDVHRRRDPHCQLTYVHWGGAIEARSFGKQRIAGDHVAHYGMGAYLVLLQMMTNRIRDMGLL